MGEFDEYFRKLFEVVGKLEQKYPDDHDVLELCTDIEILRDNQNRDDAIKCLNAFQRINDKLFERYGICDEIISLQVLINKLRYHLDVVDEKEILVHASDGDFVQ